MNKNKFKMIVMSGVVMAAFSSCDHMALELSHYASNVACHAVVAPAPQPVVVYQEPALPPVVVHHHKPAPKPQPVVQHKPAPKPQPVAQHKPASKPQPVVQQRPASKPQPGRQDKPMAVAHNKRR